MASKSLLRWWWWVDVSSQGGGLKGLMSRWEWGGRGKDMLQMLAQSLGTLPSP